MNSENERIVGPRLSVDDFIDPLFAKEMVGTNSQSLLDLPEVRLKFYLFEMQLLEMDNLSRKEIGGISHTRRF